MSRTGSTSLAYEDQDPPPLEPLGALYLQHSPWLADVLRRRYGGELAEDVTQDTFVRLATAALEERLRHPRAFLLRIAENLARNRLRNTRRRATSVYDEAMAERIGEAPSQVETVILREIVLALPPKLRDVFVLRHIRELSFQEIAQVLGISVKTVEKRMAKARALCAAAMRD